jgi:hypothetical protein
VRGADVEGAVPNSARTSWNRILCARHLHASSHYLSSASQLISVAASIASLPRFTVRTRKSGTIVSPRSP